MVDVEAGSLVGTGVVVGMGGLVDWGVKVGWRVRVGMTVICSADWAEGELLGWLDCCALITCPVGAGLVLDDPTIGRQKQASIATPERIANINSLLYFLGWLGVGGFCVAADDCLNWSGFANANARLTLQLRQFIALGG